MTTTADGELIHPVALRHALKKETEMTTLEYKGYIGSVTFDDEAGILHGSVVNTRDVITFQGESVAEVRQAFRESVEDYVAFCAELGEEPEKPMSGKFNVRIAPLLHAHAVAMARSQDISLNTLVEQAIAQAVGAEPVAASTEPLSTADSAPDCTEVPLPPMTAHLSRASHVIEFQSMIVGSHTKVREG